MRLIDADALEHDIDKYCCGNEHFKHWIQVQRTIGGWISVQDRLPEETNAYLTMQEISKNQFSYCITWFSTTKHRWWTNGITHWMPLPEPPEEDKP